MKTTKHAVASIFLMVFLTLPTFPQTDETGRFKAASEYSKRSLGVALLIMKGDEIVLEDYGASAGARIPWVIASGTKSFSGVMLAAAIEDGLISGFDEKVSDTIVEWKDDPSKRDITLRQLLNLTSGIEGGSAISVPTYKDSIHSKISGEPGKIFQYGPKPFQIFGEVMTRRLRPSGEAVRDYMDRRIFRPIGMNVSLWRRVENDPILPNGMVLTARDWARFGLFLRDNGKVGERQVISDKLIAELLKGSDANPAYGITFWLNRTGFKPNGVFFEMFESEADESLGTDIFMAAGLGNQRLYIIPSQNLVVVRFGAFGRFDDAEFLRLLFRGQVGK
jgi:CubicO group peptidase (beta-lactamase class C family)